jgi:hypothetical protein
MSSRRFHGSALEWASASGLERFSDSYRLAQTREMAAVQAESTTDDHPGGRAFVSLRGRLFRNEPRLSCAAQADRDVFSREQRLQQDAH